MPTGEYARRPVWRSLLYVRANRPRFLRKAHTRGVDAVILDLEHGVPPRERATARSMLAARIEQASRGGADVLARVIAEGAGLEQALAALEPCFPRAEIVPEVERAERAARVSGWLGMREAVRRARRIVEAYAQATQRGAGSIAIHGRRVDVPIAARVRKRLERHARREASGPPAGGPRRTDTRLTDGRGDIDG